MSTIMCNLAVIWGGNDKSLLHAKHLIKQIVAINLVAVKVSLKEA